MRFHKNWIEAYMKYTEHTESPRQFHLWTAISTIAGALRRRVWLDMGHFQWTPNLYVIFIAPPGVAAKSTTASIGSRLLRQVPDIHFGPESVTWQRLIQALGQAAVPVYPPDVEIDPVATPATYMSAITIVASELGTFMDPKDRQMMDILVDLWDSKKGIWTRSTKTQNEDVIENPWVNLIACTTPAWLKDNVPDYLIHGGFASRCVMVYADKKEKLIAYPDEHQPKDFDEQGEKLVHDLEIISRLYGKFTLAPEARQWGREWYGEHWKTSDPDERVGGYRSRKQTLIHKLAMILSAAHSNSLVITKHDLQHAYAIVSALEAEMKKVLDLIGMSQETKQANQILETIKALKRVTKQQLMQGMLKQMTAEVFNKSLNGLIEAGLVSSHSDGQKLWLYAVKDK
jgi:hypothetical protein